MSTFVNQIAIVNTSKSTCIRTPKHFSIERSRIYYFSQINQFPNKFVDSLQIYNRDERERLNMGRSN